MKTSDRVSSIAAQLVRITEQSIIDTVNGKFEQGITPAQLATDIRTVAASALRQDEVKGLRKIARRLKWPFPRTFMSSEDRP